MRTLTSIEKDVLDFLTQKYKSYSSLNKPIFNGSRFKGVTNTNLLDQQDKRVRRTSWNYLA